MPSKTPDAERNRLKQQRSRARQKQYTNSLEEQVRQHERNGVNATIHMQAAARHVLSVNKLLRQLLNAKGISDESIDQYILVGGGEIQHVQELDNLLAGQSPTQPAPSGGQERTAMVAQNSNLDLLPTPPQEKRQTTCCRPVEAQRFEVEVQHSPSRTMASQPPQMSVETSDEPQSPSGHDMSPNSTQAEPNPNQMRCEDAARIIAMMRGNVTAEEVRPEIGCYDGRSCMIGNSLVFDLA